MSGLGEPKLLAGGAIQQNWGFEADLSAGTLPDGTLLVLRTDAATGVASSLGRVEEFAVQKAAFAAGVTVAEPLWACADPDLIGRPFFVMRRVAGTAQGREITTDPALEPHLPAIAARLGEELARIQTIRPPRSDLAFLPQSTRRGTSPGSAPISTGTRTRGRCSNGPSPGSKRTFRKSCRRRCATAISVPATICSTAPN